MTQVAADPTRTAAKLPPGFLIGAATAAYQIEGGWDTDGKGLSIWDVFVRQPGTVERGERADDACRSYERWQDDADLCRELGLDAYRFSIGWSRIQPRGPALNSAGLDHYDRFVDALVERGVRPVVTLYHWDLPQWVQDRAGWADRDTAQRFADYATAVAERIGDRVHLWCTLNEPWVSTVMGNVFGIHAPGIADGSVAAAVHHHLLLAHGLGAQAIRAAGASGGVGIVNAETLIEPADDSEAAAVAAEAARDVWGRGFRLPLWGGGYPERLESVYDGRFPIQAGDMETIAQPLDFIGVNNYSRELVAPADGRLGFDRVRGPLPRTEMDWEIAPHALPGVLRVYAAEHPDLPPIYITENGMADTAAPVAGAVHDDARVDFLASYLDALTEAIDDGIDVRGYFIWTLLDNFEWSFGYRPRFGLVHVDHATGERTVKDSGRWVAALADELRRRA